MNKKHLGDAFDHWKGSLIQILSRKRIIQNLRVEPMITDNEQWGKNDSETYRKLLNLPSVERICHKDEIFVNRKQRKRKDYFGEIPKRCNLLIDPDTGIKLSENTKKKHVKLCEIKELLDDKRRVIMIYQHSQRKNNQETFDEINKEISKMTPKIHWCAYNGGQVAMIFISRKQNRIERIKKTLKSYLCGTAAKRIWPE
jgi:uncharacterized phage-like protein YoqJ